MGDEITLDERIARHRAFADMLMLAKKTKKLNIEVGEGYIDWIFSIDGEINNFYFQYFINKEQSYIMATNENHKIDIYLKNGTTDKLLAVKINDERTYDMGELEKQSEAEPAVLHDEEIVEDKLKDTNHISKKIDNGEMPSLKGLNGHEQTAVNAFFNAQKIVKKIQTEIREKVPDFFNIIGRYFGREYHPETEINPDFITNEDIFKEFDLS